MSSLRLIHRVAESRRKAAVTDILLDERIKEANVAYDDLFRTVLELQESLTNQEAGDSP